MCAKSNVRGRFAPSPTGNLHLGNIWTALLAWVHTRQLGGQFVLRVEDLDPERSRPPFAQQQLDDLAWLGLDWDEGPDIGGPYAPYTQSERTARYAAALEHLQAQGSLYECYCTRAEVHAAASAPHGAEAHGNYPGTCRDLTPTERQARTSAGRRASLRARMPDQPTLIRFDDLVVGPQEEDVGRQSGDFILRRSDGVYAYQLAVVVDDVTMAISHVIRGADLLDSTARQIWLACRLGHRPPVFGHVPLLLGPDGSRLAKRHAALTVAHLRSVGISPSQIVGALAYAAGLVERHVGALPYDLLGTLDLQRLPRGAIPFDPQDVLRISA